MTKTDETPKPADVAGRLDGLVMEMRLYWWYARYAWLAIWRLRCSLSFAWTMATAAGDEFFLAGDSPGESLDSELSYWDDDGP